MARTRTFIGLDVGDDIRKNAERLQRQLGKVVPGVNWAAPATFHVTLQFLGDLDDRDLAAVCRTVKTAAAALPPFRLSAAGVGAFPNPRRPKVVWVGLSDGADDLLAVFAALEEPLSALGVYRKEDRPYTPHLTLGRATDEAAGQALAAELGKFQDWAGGHTEVSEVKVYSSELRRDGPEYAVLGRCPLGGRRRADPLADDEDE